MNFFRGAQTTGSDGVVYFDTCFPGWYSGRAIHIHFQVTSGSTTYKVSQLFFPDNLVAAIFASHPEYKAYGQPDTTDATDSVMSGVPAADRSRNIVEYARMTDGAMLASKTVTVTS
jgi:protocatechuate 3,4-dioxygenase beta subunit